MANREFYQSPLCGRYSTEEMKRRWGDDRKFGLWRRIWLELARAERQLGLPISEAQLAEMAQHLDGIDYAQAAKLETELRHDVMAHVHLFGECAPGAAGIIHLGATSCDITDNADLILIREGLQDLEVKLARVIHRLATFAETHKSLACLGWTHYQPAVLVTVGKRACMWLGDLLMDLRNLQRVRQELRFRGIKGATGTQDSFLALFKGDHRKVRELESLVAAAFGFNRSYSVTGQTYPRKVDTEVVQTLAGLAASLHKICFDLRLLAHDKEIEEPFEKGQKGSTAMPWKRNPMREERTCSLSRHPIGLFIEAVITQMTQLLERSLDDSADRRIYLPESFLAVDAILKIAQNVFEGLVVYPAVMHRRIMEELPFMATERIMMHMVRDHGANRQECHEKLRVLAQAAAGRVKLDGKPNDLMEQLAADSYFAPLHDSLSELLNPQLFIGRCPEIVDEFLEAEVKPALAPYAGQLSGTSILSI